MWLITAQVLSASLIISGLVWLVLLAEFVLASAAQIRPGKKNGLAWGFVIADLAICCWVLEIVFNAFLIGGNAALGARGIFSLSPLAPSTYSLITLAWINLAFWIGITGRVILRIHGRRG